MYAYALLLFIGTPLLLGSLWGLLGVVLFLPLLTARVLGEEAMLLDGLPGYREYAAKVRFRLLPGVWSKPRCPWQRVAASAAEINASSSLPRDGVGISDDGDMTKRIALGS
jgi:hypothetical protein